MAADCNCQACVSTIYNAVWNSMTISDCTVTWDITKCDGLYWLKSTTLSLISLKLTSSCLWDLHGIVRRCPKTTPSPTLVIYMLNLLGLKTGANVSKYKVYFTRNIYWDFFFLHNSECLAPKNVYFWKLEISLILLHIYLCELFISYLYRFTCAVQVIHKLRHLFYTIIINDSVYPIIHT